jgi:hypothetical protein
MSGGRRRTCGALSPSRRRAHLVKHAISEWTFRVLSLRHLATASPGHPSGRERRETHGTVRCPIFRAAIEMAGCKAKECVLIGDSEEKDIVPAVQLGCAPPSSQLNNLPLPQLQRRPQQPRLRKQPKLLEAGRMQVERSPDVQDIPFAGWRLSHAADAGSPRAAHARLQARRHHQSLRRFRRRIRQGDRRPHPRQRAEEFRRFLNVIDKAVPAHLDVHLIDDNSSTHKTPG